MRKLTSSLVGLAALAMVGGAHAAIDNFDNGNSEFYLVANKVNNGSSFTFVYDTGVSFTNFLPGSGAANADQSWDFSGNAAWTSFLASAGGASGVRWAVYGGDNSGDVGTAGDLRMAMTTNQAAANMLGSDTNDFLTNGNLQGGLLTSAVFLSNTNNLASHSNTGNGASVNQGTGSTDFADFTVARQGSFGADFTPAFSPTALVDASQRFALVTNTEDLLAATSDYAGLFSLSSNGVLTYAVAAVPEPSEYALMLAGLGLVGLIARRRRQQA